MFYNNNKHMIQSERGLLRLSKNYYERNTKEENEKYRQRLNHILSQIHSTEILRYYYTFIVEKEKIRGNVYKEE